MHKLVSIEKDLPIQNLNEDLLNRNYFAKQLATAIMDYAQVPENTDGLVIGLEGPWGSGKTSLLNLTKRYLDNQNFIVKFFNPWLTSDRMSLVTEFFRTLTDFSNGESKLTKQVTKYGISIVQGLASSISIGVFGFNISLSVEKIVKKFFQQPSLYEKKEKITSDIKKNKNQPWLVIFIDDLDRLSYDEIGTVFQLVKNIADFPKVIYVLAYDHEIIAKALDKVQEGKGNEYIQKVVQVIYDIPMPGEGDVYNYFGKKLESILSGIDPTFFDKNHFLSLMSQGCLEYLQNIRDCNRVLNAFQLKYSLCGQECDVGDLLAITIMELYEPKLYALLPIYKNTLLGRGLHGILPMKKEELQDSFSHLVNQVNIYNENCCKDILLAMFPAVNKNLGTRVNDFDNNDRLSNKICYLNSFDRYFCLRIKSTDVPLEDLLSFLKLRDENIIFKQLELWRTNGQDSYAFTHLRLLLTNPNSTSIFVSNELVPLFLHALSRIYFSEESTFVSFSSAQLELMFIGALLRLTNSERNKQYQDVNFLKSIFRDKKIALYILGYILGLCSAGHAWKFASQSLQEELPVISKDEFNCLQQSYLERIKQSINDGSLFEEEYYKTTLLIWKHLDLEGYKNYIQQPHSIKEKIYLLNNFVSCFIINGNMEKRIYRINVDLNDDYDRDTAYEWAKECVESKDFKSFPTRKSDSVIAYIMIYNKSKNENSDFLKTEISQSGIEEKAI